MRPALLRITAAVLAAVGLWWTVRLVRIAVLGDWSEAWILFTFIVTCFWIAVILVRGSGRTLK